MTDHNQQAEERTGPHAAEDSVRPGANLVRREVGRWIDVPRG